ncbi:MAG: ExeA family protein, partial [Deltaproteobacteria bacterium]
MYLTHYGLQEKPFKSSPDPKYLWLGAEHKEALAALVTGILHGDGIEVVTGDIGTGKTTLANALLKELGDRVIAALVSCPEYEGIDFFKLIAKAYGISLTPQSKDPFFTRFSEFMHSSLASGRKVVMIIDDAPRLPSACLEELAALSRLEENGTRMLHIVFFGEYRFDDILSAEANRELLRKVTFRYALGPLTKDETAQYIMHRLKIAQCKREIFTPEAINEIFAYSQGVPSLINKACDAALSRSFYLGESLVQPKTIRSFLKLMPDEKVVSSGSAQGRRTEAAGQAMEKAGGDVKPGIVNKAPWKQHWNRIAYAALGCFLAVAVGFTLWVMQSGQQPAPAKTEAKKEASPPESPPASAGAIRGSDANAPPQAS